MFSPSYLVYHVSRLRDLLINNACCSRSNSAPPAETKEFLLACTSHTQVPMSLKPFMQQVVLILYSQEAHFNKTCRVILSDTLKSSFDTVTQWKW